MSAALAPPPPETVVVHDHRVACDGIGGALGHPRVYLEIGAKGFVECGYCDRRFVLAGHGDHDSEKKSPAAYDPQDVPEA